jgi:hypothetical protein
MNNLNTRRIIMIGLDIMLERLDKAGMKAHVVGGDRNSELIVDGKAVGRVVDDTVYLY